MKRKKKEDERTYNSLVKITTIKYNNEIRSFDSVTQRLTKIEVKSIKIEQIVWLTK